MSWLPEVLAVMVRRVRRIIVVFSRSVLALKTDGL